MKVKELIEKLQKVDGNNTVYLLGDGKHAKGDYYDFTGISFDDNNDVQLYIIPGDKEA